MGLINGSVITTVKVLIENMRNKIAENTSILANEPTRYDLRSENHTLTLYIEQMMYHLSKRSSKTQDLPRYDKNALLYLLHIFCPKYMDK